jgi:hypothetical protein
MRHVGAGVLELLEALVPAILAWSPRSRVQVEIGTQVPEHAGRHFMFNQCNNALETIHLLGFTDCPPTKVALSDGLAHRLVLSFNQLVEMNRQRFPRARALHGSSLVNPFLLECQSVFVAVGKKPVDDVPSRDRVVEEAFYSCGKS